MLYPVILAGGTGTRLWPASTKDNPKQFKSFLGNKSLLQNTYDRLVKGFDSKDIYINTSSQLADSLAKKLNIPVANIIAEPVVRNTAFAIGFTALKLSEMDKEAIIATINSDHYVKAEDIYLKSIKAGAAVIEKQTDKLMLLGTKPSYADTASGYIELGRETKDKGVYEVASYKEKPDLALAEKYVADGKHLLNPAIFIFKASQLLKWYQEYLPDIYKALMEIKDSGKTDYSSFQSISIDYGLLEKLDGMLVMPADFDWTDIGNWRSLRDIQSDGSGQVSNTEHVSIDSHNNLLYSDSNKMIATIGVKDMILVETDKAIFLCPADRAQEVRELVKKMSDNNLDKYL